MDDTREKIVQATKIEDPLGYHAYKSGIVINKEKQ